MQNSVQSKLTIRPKIALEAPTFVEKLSSCGVGVVREVRVGAGGKYQSECQGNRLSLRPGRRKEQEKEKLRS